MLPWDRGLLRRRLSEYEASRVTNIRNNERLFSNREGHRCGTAVLAVEATIDLHGVAYLRVAFGMQIFKNSFIK